MPVGKQRLEMNYEPCPDKPDVKGFQREIRERALWWALWGRLSLLVPRTAPVTAVDIKLHPGAIGLLWAGEREMTVVYGCRKKTVCLEEISWIGFDLCSK